MSNIVRKAVPQIDFCEELIPRVFLGDRPYLARYGCNLSVSAITRKMEYCVKQASFGLSSSDTNTAQSVRSLYEVYGSKSILHTQNLIKIGAASNIDRMAASIRERINRSTNTPDNDLVIGSFLKLSVKHQPYTLSQIEGISLDTQSIEYAERLIEIARPSIITIGGDWLDLCLLYGQQDIAHRVISRIKSAASAQTKILLLTYFCGTPEFSSIIKSEDGVFLPINLAGDGMFPNKCEVIDFFRNSTRNVIAFNTLALGRIPPAPALDYVFNHLSIPCAVVASGTNEHIDDLIGAASLVLGF